jgi:hypothetical protein
MRDSDGVRAQDVRHYWRVASFRPSWSLGPDRIYFMIEERESDISVMEVKPR